LWSTGWGRSELAADLYDEILFNGATYGDLKRGGGPMIIASATDITTGARLPFTQTTFDVLCADLDAVRIARAAAASSAVPVVLSPITLNNYGGSCNYTPPGWIAPFIDAEDPPRPAARAIRHMREEAEFADGANRPYIHLVDGGVADNVGMRSVLDVLELMEALQSAGLTTPLDHIRKVIVFVVNSLSIPEVNWDKSEAGPGTLQIMVKAAGVPIDHYSYESTELLRDMQAKWKSMRLIRTSRAYAAEKDEAIRNALHTPDATIYAIDVSFSQLKDKNEIAYLNELPTSFRLAPEEVDRLRAAAGKIILESPDFRRLIQDLGGRIEPAEAR
jgi:NTE family protein